ncbi:MAG: hypothetical protein DMG24_11040 [Acidobacteria bacterium]|nr:MAG: hypothetical protein DMG24_11040 [Acidobacteriota bacterium]
MQVTDDASNSPQTASLKGGPFAYFNPPSLTFASQQVGTTSAAQNIHLVSQGFDGEGSPLVVSSVSISGANAGDFSQTNACNSFGCALQVTFTPTASGTRTAALVAYDNATTSPQTASLTGTGVSSVGGSPAASLSPTSLTFSSQSVGTTSPAQAVMLSNSGSAALSITSIAMSGANSGDFAATNTCGNSLAASASCTINVTFTPATSGTRSAALTVTDNASGSPQTVSLTGTGTSSSGGGSAPAVVQVQNNIDASGAAFASFSVPITTQPGDLLVAFVRESSNGTDNFTVTDSAGQTWTQTTSGYNNESDTGPRTGMFYVANSAAVTSVTVNYTTAGGVIKPGIMVMEISGATTTGVADGSVNSGAAGDTTTSTSGSLTTTNANDILIFATDTSGNEAGWTAASGYAIPNNKLMIGASGSNVRMAMQVAVVSSVQTNTTTGMSYANSNWNGNIFAAFK